MTDDAWVLRIPKPRRRVMGAAAGILVVLLLATTALLNGTKRVQLNGISFDVPFGWTVHTDIPATTGPGDAVALIGTLPWGACDAYDINCHYRERLSSGQIEVEVGVRNLLDMCSFAHDRPDLEPRSDGVRVTETHYFRADGRPAIVTIYSFDGTTDYYGSDGWRTWMFAQANSVEQVYSISAKWRGPGDEAFSAALDRLVSSIKLPTTNPNSPVPDCGDPFPPAGSAT